ncbi:MAG: efflux RND transporter periplasmic adaptor subunit [Kofleriaceae bacterium]
MHGFAVRLLIPTLVFLAACNKKAADDGALLAPPPPPIKVDLVSAEKALTPKTLVLTGMIAADQRAEVTPDTQGKVLAVMVERGQRVKMGEPLVRLDVRNAALGAREAQANLAAARAQKALAEEECKRTRQLLDKGAITRSEYDRQSTQCTSALEQVAGAQARAEMMSKSVADGMVRAPFDGIVADKNVTPGEWVAPGRPLLTLVDDDPLKIELSVPEIAVRAVQVGQKVTLTATAIPCVTHTATLSRIGGEIGRTRSLIVEATIDKSGAVATASPECKEEGVRLQKVGHHIALVPGMFAEAMITIAEVERVVVPATAIAQRGKTWHVFVAKNGELYDRIVLPGPSNVPGTVAIVRGDVNAGDSVANHIVTDTGLRPDLVDGARVEGGTSGASPKPPTPTPPAPATPTTGSSK